ncbi:MAG: DNA primase small subunit domain-containing protein [Thermoprotei archaeon]|nr:DNA primase small subunit domain-containing protein [TACK group archaeon]
MQDQSVLDHFRDYYTSLDPDALFVPDLQKREFGFMPRERREMIRHMAFRDLVALKSYIISLPPSHVYSSTALYERPSAPDMNSKGWLGSEIVFEFDADHMREFKGDALAKSGILTEEAWNAIKKRTAELIDDFLIQDFGISSSEIKITFSGNRGFHVRVRRQEFLGLDQEARRRLVSYLNASDLDVNGLQNLLGKAKKRSLEVVLSQPGWMSKIRRQMKEKNCSLQEAVDALALDVDENVALDLHRLIRHPSSLHAGTGLVVKPVTLESLSSFMPYQDALVRSSTELRVNMVDLLPSGQFQVGDLEVSKALAGRVIRVQRSVGIFLILKGLARPAVRVP